MEPGRRHRGAALRRPALLLAVQRGAAGGRRPAARRPPPRLPRITQYAADQLGEIVYVELPEVGTEAEAGEPCGEVESTKSVSDIYAPVSGEVVAVNEDLEDSAAVINDDPYGEGWIYEVRVTEAGPLMDAEAYAAENDD